MAAWFSHGCVRDARPTGPGLGRAGSLARRRPGAVGHSRIVAYGARSPARSAAEGHAQRPCFLQYPQITTRNQAPRALPHTPLLCPPMKYASAEDRLNPVTPAGVTDTTLGGSQTVHGRAAAFH